jgi:hypothetical protein
MGFAMELRDATQHIAPPRRACTPEFVRTLSCCADPGLQVLCAQNPFPTGAAQDLHPVQFHRMYVYKKRSVTTRISGAPISKAALFSIMNKNNSIAAGKYLLSPLTREPADGRFGSAVSIRNGSHDRVMRFVALFDDATTATQYAVEQGLQWVRARHANPSAAHA